MDGGQGEAVRVPQAQGTLVTLPVDENSALLPSAAYLVRCVPHRTSLRSEGQGRATHVGDGGR